jgi:hypothetical protein
MDLEHGNPHANPNHIPLPRWFFFTKIAQLVLAVIILALDAAAIAEITSNSYGYAPGFIGSPNYQLFAVSDLNILNAQSY